MIDTEIWVKVMEHIAKERYSGRLKEENVTEEYILKLKERLSKPPKTTFWRRLLNRFS